MMGWYGNLGWFGPLTMVLFWAAIVGLFVWFVTAVVQRPAATGPESETALEVLKRRYAAGDIRREEYEEKRKTLLG